MTAGKRVAKDSKDTSLIIPYSLNTATSDL